MKFDMTKPCTHCPFRIDSPCGWLGKERAIEIITSLLNGQEFACHTTTKIDGDGERMGTCDSQMCAGALIVMEKIELQSQIMRVAQQLEMYDPDSLDMDSLVFDDFDQFISHHF